MLSTEQIRLHEDRPVASHFFLRKVRGGADTSVYSPGVPHIAYGHQLCHKGARGVSTLGTIHNVDV